MRKTPFFVLLSVVLAGSALAVDSPTLFSPAQGNHNWVPASRDVCWSEPADLSDYKISSEIIAALGLESELANDFVVASNTTITKAIGYGGYYNWVQGDPPITSLNWKFYDDGGCVPNNLMNTYTGWDSETFIGFDGFGYPTYRYEKATNIAVTANEIYWLGLQAADHPFPPQWGRQGTGFVVTNCDTVFKSAFFSYPNWTPAGDLVGGPYDAAQEFECDGVVANKVTSWGSIKGLYR
jgi:hypothetical protein